MSYRHWAEHFRIRSVYPPCSKWGRTAKWVWVRQAVREFFSDLGHALIAKKGKSKDWPQWVGVVFVVGSVAGLCFEAVKVMVR